MRIINNEICVSDFTRPEMAVLIESVHLLGFHDTMT